MKKRNALIAVIVIISLICVIPPLVTRIKYETSHNAFEAAIVLTPQTTEEEIETFKENGITTLIADETDSQFDKAQIRYAKKLGFEIALRINVGEKPDEDFESRLGGIIRENDIKYMLIAQNKDNQSFDAPLEKVIEENAMTVVVCEEIKQLSNEKPKGYERYTKAAGGRLMRCYTTLKDPARSLNTDTSTDTLGELLYHHMSNSLRDRNTEFMAINIIENPSVSREDAIKASLYAAKKFKETALRLGYEEGKDISLKGYATDVRIPTSASVMLACIMALVSVEILLKKRNPSLEWIFCILAFAGAAVVCFLPQKLLLLIPSAFAPISAAFSFSISIGAAKYLQNKKLTLFKSLLPVFASALLSLFLGAICLGAMLSGTEYYLNNLIFRGVKLSLIMPIIYAFLFMWIYEKQKLSISTKGVKKLFSGIKISHLVIIAIAAIAVFVYISRSGNAKISPLENAFRNFVADISGERPRTKEFVIGWPLLALSVYLIHVSAPKLLCVLCCAGSSVLFASVTNTFCHVFADFSISVLRTFNGLLFSLPIIVILLLIAKLIAGKKTT